MSLSLGSMRQRQMEPGSVSLFHNLPYDVILHLLEYYQSYVIRNGRICFRLSPSDPRYRLLQTSFASDFYQYRLNPFNYYSKFCLNVLNRDTIYSYMMHWKVTNHERVFFIWKNARHDGPGTECYWKKMVKYEYL